MVCEFIEEMSYINSKDSKLHSNNLNWQRALFEFGEIVICFSAWSKG